MKRTGVSNLVTLTTINHWYPDSLLSGSCRCCGGDILLHSKRKICGQRRLPSLLKVISKICQRFWHRPMSSHHACVKIANSFSSPELRDSSPTFSAWPEPFASSLWSNQCRRIQPTRTLWTRTTFQALTTTFRKRPGATFWTTAASSRRSFFWREFFRESSHRRRPTSWLLPDHVRWRHCRCQFYLKFAAWFARIYITFHCLSLANLTNVLWL